jgi:hypothetical protein
MAVKKAKKKRAAAPGRKAPGPRGPSREPGKPVLLPAIVAAAVLALLAGGYWLVHPRTAAPSAPSAPSMDGAIIVNNMHQGTCSVDQQGRPCPARVSLDGAAAVDVADENKYVFAGLAQGSHSIAVSSDCSELYAKNGVWNCVISLAPGSTYTVLLTCGANGALSPSCPASP